MGSKAIWTHVPLGRYQYEYFELKEWEKKWHWYERNHRIDEDGFPLDKHSRLTISLGSADYVESVVYDGIQSEDAPKGGGVDASWGSEDWDRHEYISSRARQVLPVEEMDGKRVAFWKMTLQRMPVEKFEREIRRLAAGGAPRVLMGYSYEGQPSHRLRTKYVNCYTNEDWHRNEQRAMARHIIPQTNKRGNSHMKNPTLKLYTDGCSRGNPGPGAVGIVIKDTHGRLIDTFARPVGIRVTNNIAEYKAVINALQVASRETAGRVDVYSDSKLVMDQLNMACQCRQPHLVRLKEKVRTLQGRFLKVTFAHVPRTNPGITEADLLANQALDEFLRGDFKKIRPKKSS